MNYLRAMIVLSVMASFTISMSVCILETATAIELPTPSSYGGTVPCDTCPEKVYWLNLLPNDAYQMRVLTEAYGDNPAKTKDEYGIWDFSEEGDTLLLYPVLGYPTKATMDDGSGLRIVSGRREMTEDAGPITLLLRNQFVPIEPRVFLRGKFLIVNGVPIFRDCCTSIRYRVSETHDYQSTLKAYEKYKKEPGDERLISLLGQIQEAEPGSGEIGTLIIEDFTGLWPPEVCGRWFQIGQIEDATWWLMGLNGKVIGTPINMREPSLRLNSDGRQASIFAGCNQMTGGYEMAGDKLQFGDLGGTMMYCALRMDLEKEFQEALSQVRSWAIQGGLLRLNDVDGELLAWFEMRYTK